MPVSVYDYLSVTFRTGRIHRRQQGKLAVQITKFLVELSTGAAVGIINVAEIMEVKSCPRERIPHCLENQLTDGGKHRLLFSASDNHFC
jgi:hypothetical protein